MTISLLSLMGIPPLAGFVSKLFILFSAIYADLIWLALIGIINSAISIFYYLRVLKLMIMDIPKEERVETQIVKVEQMRPYTIPISYGLTIGIGVLLIVLVGLFPEQIFDFAVNAARNLMGQ